MYKVAIYIEDYLLLLELVARIEKDFPNIEYTIFGDKSFENSLKDSADGYVITELSLLKDFDVLIMLSQPSQDSDYIRNFDGSIIDISGYQFNNDEVHFVAEPIRQILRNIKVPVENTSVTLDLPVCVYGKNGVEDLMNQTKNIFTFDNSEGIIFKNRIAFNKHFNPIIAGLPVGKTVDDFAEAGGDISIRLSSLSTVFVMDIFAGDKFGLKDEDGYSVIEGFFMVSDVAERDDIVVQPRRYGLTFVGDYVRVLTENVMKKLKEVIG